MNKSVAERRVINQPQGIEFFEDAITAYGREGARDICDVLIASIEAARLHVPTQEPLSGLKLAVADMDDFDCGTAYIAFAEVSSRVMKMMLNSTMPVEDILPHIPSGVTHEFGHFDHYRLNPRIYNAPGTFLKYTIREGVAEYCANSQDETYEPGYVYNQFPEVLDKIEETLLEILYYAGEGQQERHYEYVLGDETFVDRGYVVGHAVVANMAVVHGYDMRQLMELSLADWRKFMEYEL